MPSDVKKAPRAFRADVRSAALGGFTCTTSEYASAHRHAANYTDVAPRALLKASMYAIPRSLGDRRSGLREVAAVAASANMVG